MDNPETDGNRGRDASRPSAIPRKGWKDILWRVWTSLTEDRVLLIAGGITFYVLLALFPALVAFMSIYGLVFDPATAVDQAAALRGILPDAASALIEAQLTTLASRQQATLTLGLVLSLLIAFWSANGGVKAMIEGLNVAYDEREKRSFVQLNLVAFGFTLGVMLLAMIMVLALAVIPASLVFLDMGTAGALLIRFARWPILAVAVGLALAVLYRHGPSRTPPEWRWVTWGSGLATLFWLIMSVGFGLYLDRFATFDATYGALAAPIAFLLWVWLSTIVVILGGEVNGEMEHQTKVDTTTGPDHPMGSRGARMADTLGRTAD